MKKWSLADLCIRGVMVLAILALLALLTMAILRQDKHDSDKPQDVNVYKGEVGEYTVEINESNFGQGFRRIVFLWSNRSPSYVTIVGYDYNDDGQWDRISYCGYPETANGRNSVNITRFGERVWDPCPADKDSLQPFTLGEVVFAKQQLDKAMATVHRPQFRVSTIKD